MTSRIRLCLLLVLTCAASLALLLPRAAGASSPLHEGSGYRLANGDFVGYYVTATGTKVYCLSPRKALPGGVTLRTVTHYPGVTVTVSRQLTYALHRWGDVAGRDAAAVESQLLNTIVGNRADVARRAGSLPRRLAAAVAHRLTLTRLLAGPYRLAVHLPKALLPGQSAVGNVEVVSSTGRALPGATVTITTSANVRLPKRVTTAAGGLGRFTYTVTDVGAVQVRATATGLPTEAIRVNSPAPSQQHMVSWAGTTTVSGSATFHRAARGFAGSYSCDTACAGHPLVRLRACADSSAHARRIVWHAGSRQVVHIFAPSTRAVCASVTVRLADRDRVRGAWQFRTSHGWSRSVPARGSFVVDCPPVPAVTVAMTYDCSTASLTIALAGVNGSTHQQVLVIGGAVSRRIAAGKGQRATFTTRVSCAAPATYTMQAGIQRANGAFHYGAQASVTTPRA